MPNVGGQGKVTFVVDGATMAELTRGPDGPVVLDLIARGDRLIALGTAQIEDRRSSWRGNHEGKLTLRKRFGTTERGPTMLVWGSSFSDPDYAYWVHEGNGSEGGCIYPRTEGGVLAFVTEGDRPSDAAGWRAARAEGRAIVVRSVRASNPNRFLSDNLPKVMPR